MNENERLKDKLLSDKNGEIDNAVWEAVRAMAAEEPEWNMFIIGQIEEFIDSLLDKCGIPACWPWENESGTVCCLTDEACRNCPHRTEVKA